MVLFSLPGSSLVPFTVLLPRHSLTHSLSFSDCTCSSVLQSVRLVSLFLLFSPSHFLRPLFSLFRFTSQTVCFIGLCFPPSPLSVYVSRFALLPPPLFFRASHPPSFLRCFRPSLSPSLSISVCSGWHWTLLVCSLLSSQRHKILIITIHISSKLKEEKVSTEAYEKKRKKRKRRRKDGAQ